MFLGQGLDQGPLESIVQEDVLLVLQEDVLDHQEDLQENRLEDIHQEEGHLYEDMIEEKEAKLVLLAKPQNVLEYLE